MELYPLVSMGQAASSDGIKEYVAIASTGDGLAMTIFAEKYFIRQEKPHRS
jgi:hypothetical protein